MKKTIDYLYRLKQANDEMGNYEAFNLYKAIEELENLKNRSCETVNTIQLESNQMVLVGISVGIILSVKIVLMIFLRG